MKRPRRFGLVLILCGLAVSLMATRTARGDVVVFPASKDNTLYRESGSLSNGAGQNFFAGHTSFLTDTVRRAVIAFDIAGNIPVGSTINSVTLTLHLSRVSLGAPASTMELHRLLADWGEGTSNPIGPGGGGAPATPGDATWTHRFFNTTFLWSTSGGDFSPTVSASRTVTGIAFYIWGPATQLRDDVQGWLDTPSSNFGWLVRASDEVSLQTARGFDSRQSLTVANRPALTVNFTPPASGAGRVPDGGQIPGTPLTIEHAAGGAITLSWGDSCLASDNDFELYEGTLLQPFAYNHLFNLCATGGPTATIMPAPGSTYYLIVPRNGPREGSYGTDSTLGERPQGAPACLSQEIANCP